MLVELLEVIDLQRQQGEGLLLLLTTLPQGAHLLFKVFAVIEAGEHLRGLQFFDGLLGLFQILALFVDDLFLLPAYLLHGLITLAVAANKERQQQAPHRPADKMVSAHRQHLPMLGIEQRGRLQVDAEPTADITDFVALLHMTLQAFGSNVKRCHVTKDPFTIHRGESGQFFGALFEGFQRVVFPGIRLVVGIQRLVTG